MTTTTRASVSQILRSKDDTGGDEEDEPKKKSREDWRKAKELEEARKAGTAPAAVDESDPTEIPQPHWAWEAEQSRIALDQRRLAVQEAMLVDVRRAVRLFERSVVAQETTATTLGAILVRLPPPDTDSQPN